MAKREWQEEKLRLRDRPKSKEHKNVQISRIEWNKMRINSECYRINSKSVFMIGFY